MKRTRNFFLLAVASLLLVQCCAGLRVPIHRPKGRITWHDNEASAASVDLDRSVYHSGFDGARIPISGYPSFEISVPISGGTLTTYSFYMDIFVNQQPYTVLVDTGSSNLAIQTSPSAPFTPLNCSSTACQTCSLDGPDAPCLYNQPFCVGEDEDVCGFGITYGGASSYLGGKLGTGIVCLDNTAALCVKVSYGVIENPGLKGIIGFASPHNACNPTCVKTVQQELLAQQSITNSFSMCLTKSDGGVIIFEPAPEKNYIQYVPIVRDTWYEIGLYDIRVGTNAGPGLNVPEYLYTATNDVIGSFIDSGTTVILMNPVIFAALQEVYLTVPGVTKLPGVTGKNSFFAGGCLPEATVTPYLSSYPDLTFMIHAEGNGTVALSVPASSYLLLVDGQYCPGFASNGGVGVILGDTFLQNFYTVYDRANMRIGFASAEYC